MTEDAFKVRRLDGLSDRRSVLLFAILLLLDGVLNMLLRQLANGQGHSLGRCEIKGQRHENQTRNNKSNERRNKQTKRTFNDREILAQRLEFVNSARHGHLFEINGESKGNRRERRERTDRADELLEILASGHVHLRQHVGGAENSLANSRRIAHHRRGKFLADRCEQASQQHAKRVDEKREKDSEQRKMSAPCGYCTLSSGRPSMIGSSLIVCEPSVTGLNS